MSIKFSANITMMFSELPTLAERYGAAKAAGFKYVESAFPYFEPLESLRDAKEKAGVEQIVINTWPGDLKKGDVGLAALPDRQQEFESKLDLAIKTAKALNCKRIHVMAGMKPDNCNEAEMESTYIKNVTMAAKKFQPEGITCLIEPLNSRITAPRYFLTDVNKGHIQIAQVPDRGEPDRQGEINFPYVFDLLRKLNYDGFVGLEYKPRGNTLDGLKWIKEYGLEV
uniref:Putative hydroxypyruvate isomerase n=1 Tax=Magallana gigas TaxID=29159 RepID=A0A8W8L6P1_MAGGI